MQTVHHQNILITRSLKTKSSKVSENRITPTFLQFNQTYNPKSETLSSPSTSIESIKMDFSIDNEAVIFAILALKQEIAHLSNNSFSVQIYDLESENYILKMPLSLIISKQANEYFAEFVDVNLFGVGFDEKDAICKCKESLIIYFENLKSEKNLLSKKLQTKLKFLSNIIVSA